MPEKCASDRLECCLARGSRAACFCTRYTSKTDARARSVARETLPGDGALLSRPRVRDGAAEPAHERFRSLERFWPVRSAPWDGTNHFPHTPKSLVPRGTISLLTLCVARCRASKIARMTARASFSHGKTAHGAAHRSLSPHGPLRHLIESTSTPQHLTMLGARKHQNLTSPGPKKTMLQQPDGARACLGRHRRVPPGWGDAWCAWVRSLTPAEVGIVPNS